MRKNNYKPKMPDLMEAIFDAAYLLFDLTAGILFFVFSKGSSLFVLYGILTLTLCGGDAFQSACPESSGPYMEAMTGSRDSLELAYRCLPSQ